MKKLKESFLLLFTVTVLSCLFSIGSYAASAVAGTVETAGGRLNVRTAPSGTATVIKSVNNKTHFAVYGESNNYYKIQYAEGKYGYCSKDYIRLNSAAQRAYVNTPGDVLNVRNGAGLSYGVKDKLPHGSEVTVIEKGDSFHKVIYKGANVGYVYASYLRTKADYSKVSLAVPSFKQTDSRWKDVAIGTQGGTIGSIGCTTTALAMTESFRTGKTVTPPVMRNRLSYSASGSLYWPSDYNTELVSSSDYLSKIYKLLKAGKPVVLGLKGKTQHWVVVTGHSAESSQLSAKNFTVNDPGSNVRSTLNAVLSVYPEVYKIAYYK